MVRQQTSAALSSPELERWQRYFYEPLAPHPEFDQGDPYILVVPSHVQTDTPFYIYTSGEEPGSGRAIHVYGWDGVHPAVLLGQALVDEIPRAHWAPCVRYVPGLERPYVMLVSHAMGLGEAAHIGHQIVRAHSQYPQGPFEYSGHVLTPIDEVDFAIDPDVYQTPSGMLKMAWATDFVSDPPLGTGIVEAPINEDLTVLTGPRTVLARARSKQQIYEENRVMVWKKIPGVDWSRGDRVEWYTVEAPVGLISPQGRRVVLYSTGCFYRDNYAVGALVEDQQGNLIDVTNERGHFVIQSQPEQGLYSLGHPSVFGNGHFLMIHMRQGSVEAPRQMAVVPLFWTQDDLPYCPTKTELDKMLNA